MIAAADHWFVQSKAANESNATQEEEPSIGTDMSDPNANANRTITPVSFLDHLSISFYLYVKSSCLSSLK